MGTKQIDVVVDPAAAAPALSDDGVYSSGSFVSDLKRLRIHTHAWRPKVKPRALVFWLHGLNDYASRRSDDKLGRHLVDGAIALYAHDQPSFGRSDGERGRRAYVSKFNVWTSAALQYINLVCERPENEGIPFVLLGESMGGMVAIDLAVNHLQSLPASSPLRRRWRGVAMIAPGIVACELPPPAMIAILKMLAQLRCLGNVGVVDIGDEEFQRAVFHPDKINDGTVAALVADGERTVRVLRADGSSRPPTPLAYKGKMKLSTAYAMKRREEAIVGRELAAFDAPHLLLLHGDADANVDIRGSERLHAESRTPPECKELVRISGGCHDLLNDPSVDAVLDKIRSFVLASCEEKS